MNMSRRMTAKEAITRFHRTRHSVDAMACLENAELYKRCKQIPEKLRGALFWCRLARMSDHDGSVKKRAAGLMRALMKELNDEDMDCVERSLFVYINMPFDLEYAPFPSYAHAAPEEIKQALRDWREEAVQHPEITVRQPRDGKPKPAIIYLEGHGRLIGYGVSHNLSPELWRTCLTAAKAFGWPSSGTSAPAGYKGEWTGSYYPAENQMVKSDDARELRIALERMIHTERARKEMTEEQRKALNELLAFDRRLSSAQELADYTLDGEFLVCKRPYYAR